MEFDFSKSFAIEGGNLVGVSKSAHGYDSIVSTFQDGQVVKSERLCALPGRRAPHMSGVTLQTARVLDSDDGALQLIDMLQGTSLSELPGIVATCNDHSDVERANPNLGLLTKTFELRIQDARDRHTSLVKSWTPSTLGRGAELEDTMILNDRGDMCVLSFNGRRCEYEARIVIHGNPGYNVPLLTRAPRFDDPAKAVGTPIRGTTMSWDCIPDYVVFLTENELRLVYNVRMPKQMFQVSLQPRMIDALAGVKLLGPTKCLLAWSDKRVYFWHLNRQETFERPPQSTLMKDVHGVRTDPSLCGTHDAQILLARGRSSVLDLE